MNNLIGMKMDVRHKKYTIGLYDIFIFVLCLQTSSFFSQFSPGFFPFFSMIFSTCSSMFVSRLHIFFLLRSMDLDLNLTFCSIQHRNLPFSESFAFFAAIKLFFQSNFYPIGIFFPFSPLFFKYSACSSILLNTRCIHKTLHDEFHFLAAIAALYLHR